MALSRRSAPFDSPDWILECKYDGYRAVAYLEGDASRLVSRRGDVFPRFAPLARALATALKVETAILDGEVIACDETGRPIFLDLLRSARPPSFIAFDLVWLDGEDLRPLPLVEGQRRKCTPSVGAPDGKVRALQPGIVRKEDAYWAITPNPSIHEPRLVRKGRRAILFGQRLFDARSIVAAVDPHNAGIKSLMRIDKQLLRDWDTKKRRSVHLLRVVVDLVRRPVDMSALDRVGQVVSRQTDQLLDMRASLERRTFYVSHAQDRRVEGDVAKAQWWRSSCVGLRRDRTQRRGRLAAQDEQSGRCVQ